jgi:ribosomal-protein-alanine N-acetyltransferase
MARPIVRGQRVALWRPRADERREFLAAVAASRELHAEWVHPPRDNVGYSEFLRRARARDRMTFIVRRPRDRSTGSLIGVVNVNNIAGGSFANATLGYYGFTDGVGGGRMTEAVRLAIGYCFGPLGLHRVEVNIQPGNVASRQLAERLALRYEGFSPRMLHIGGEWRDHDRFAITSEEWGTAEE